MFNYFKYWSIKHYLRKEVTRIFINMTFAYYMTLNKKNKFFEMKVRSDIKN